MDDETPETPYLDTVWQGMLPHSSPSLGDRMHPQPCGTLERIHKNQTTKTKNYAQLTCRPLMTAKYMLHVGVDRKWKCGYQE